MPRIRVAVLATYPAVRAGLAALLAAAGHEVLDDDAAAEADVLVTDAIALVDETASVVLLTDVAAPEVAAALPRDASAAMIDAAVRAVHAGLHVTHPAFEVDARLDTGLDATPASDLTPREIEVLHLLAAGMTNRGAALALGISEHTVKFHVGSTLAKLGARSRTEAVSIAARMGLLPL